MRLRFFLFKSIPVLLIVVGLCTPVAAQKKVILNIASYHAGYNWTDTCVSGIVSEMKEEYQVYNFYMNTKRIPTSQFKAAADRAWSKFVELSPVLVMLGDDNALQLLGPKLSETQKPVVFYGINANPRIYFKNDMIPGNVTGVLERPLYFPLVRTIKELMEIHRGILILLDDSTTSKAIVETTLMGQHEIKINEISVASKHISHFTQWKEAVLKAPEEYDAIILSTLFTIKNQKDQVINEMDILRWTSQHSKIPIFGTLEFMTQDDGAVGALAIIGKKHGQAAAIQAKKVLAGNYPVPITMDTEGKFFFNKKQLKRFNIDLPTEIKKFSVFR